MAGDSPEMAVNDEYNSDVKVMLSFELIPVGVTKFG